MENWSRGMMEGWKGGRVEEWIMTNDKAQMSKDVKIQRTMEGEKGY